MRDSSFIKAQDRRCSSAETRRVSLWNSASVARTCFLGPRHVPDGQGKAADLKNRSALRFLGPSFCPCSAAERLSMLSMTALSGFSAACKAPHFRSRGETSGLTSFDRPPQNVNQIGNGRANGDAETRIQGAESLMVRTALLARK
jgi:hypothetical protein